MKIITRTFETSYKHSLIATLYYGKDDTTTFFENSTRAHDAFIANGADPQIIKLVSFDGKNHDSAEGPWVASLLEWFESF